MSDDRAKTPRTLLIADHLWEAFALMAEEMGADRDALLNQALYTFARLNGFLLPADLARLGAVPQPGLTDSARLRVVPPPAEDRRRGGGPARVDELADELESGSIPPPVPSPPPVEDAEASAAEVDDEPPPEAILATSMELPGGGGATGRVRAPIAAAEEPGVAVSGGPTLVLLSDGRELDRVVKDRFLIGRGKHCDLIINSGKVSREHAAITREGSTWFIEDLGSSNGTWFEKRRISRRQIQEGDEYYICAEKLSCSFR
jgi:hypothetical protein